MESLYTATEIGGGGYSDGGRKLVGGRVEGHPRSGMLKLFVMENFSRALGRGGRRRGGMVGFYFDTTSYIWNPVLQLGLVIFTVLLAQKDLSLWQDQSRIKNAHHSCCFSDHLRPRVSAHPFPVMRKLGKGWE